MSEHDRTDRALEQHHSKHYAPPQHKLQRTLDIILGVVSADLLVNMGVFASGIVVMAVELGWIQPPDHQPQRVVIVRQVPANDLKTGPVGRR